MNGGEATRPLRFCMVTTFYPPYHFGGDALFVRELARELVAAGHSVEVVHCEDAYRLLADRGRPTEAVEDAGVVVHRLRSPWGPLSPLFTQQTGRPGPKAASLRRILGRGFDVIHFHNLSLVGGPAALALGDAPVKLYTPHEFWLFCATHVLWKNDHEACGQPQCLSCSLRSGIPPQLWRYTGLVSRSLHHVQALLALGAYSAQRHRESGITCPIEILPTFAKVPSPPPYVPGPRPNFVYAGRLVASKGVMHLVQEFRNLPDYDLTLLGGGNLEAELKRAAASCGNIRILGEMPRETLITYLQRATAVILPCIGPETAPLVVVEAMGCGTPVVVRQAGGSAESIEASGGGVVYQGPAELAPIVRRLAEEPQWRETLAGKARQGYLERHTPAIHLRRYLEIVHSLRTYGKSAQFGERCF